MVEKQLDRIGEFVKLKADTATAAEITTRLEALENAFTVFLTLQGKLEDADPLSRKVIRTIGQSTRSSTTPIGRQCRLF